MLTAIIRQIPEQDEVFLTLSNVDGMPLFASTTSKYSSVEEAQAAVAAYELEWQRPAPDSDETV